MILHPQHWPGVAAWNVSMQEKNIAGGTSNTNDHVRFTACGPFAGSKRNRQVESRR
jgi:hypothetical protein